MFLLKDLKTFFGEKKFSGKKKFWVTTVTTVITVTTDTTVTTVTNVTTITQVGKFQLQFDTRKVFFFRKVTDGRTDKLTTRHLELLQAAENLRYF